MKAQLKIHQMAFMIMAVFIFFILAGLFYLVIYMQDLKKEVNIEEKNRATEMAGFLASSAEFSCGDYCIDGDRAMILGNRTVFQKLWQVSSIEIRTVYPSNNTEILCTISNYPYCNLIKIYSNKKGGESTASSFVSLCHRVNENDYIYFQCEVAKLIIGYKTQA
ncbi:hypothetical protein FJZ19_00250 [Candidatus Pacearchaeota archaeon]|nr:hypothetical protein [Candidatus Pacearchaeota archaeon]